MTDKKAMNDEEYEEYLERLHDEKLDEWYNVNLLEEYDGEPDDFDYDEENEIFYGGDDYGFYVTFDKNGVYQGKSIDAFTTHNPPSEHVEQIIKDLLEGIKEDSEYIDMDNFRFYAHYAPKMTKRMIKELCDDDGLIMVLTEYCD